MINPAEVKNAARKLWGDVDDAWQAELEKVYKLSAGDARYNKTLNAATPELAKLYAAFSASRDAYHAIKAAF
jgi:hypothetical protein